MFLKKTANIDLLNTHKVKLIFSTKFFKNVVLLGWYSNANHQKYREADGLRLRVSVGDQVSKKNWTHEHMNGWPS